MRVPRVHSCVFTCAHMYVLTGHVYVFHENTCVLSDEVLRMHMYACSRVRIWVFHV